MYKSQFQKIDPYDWLCGPGSHLLIFDLALFFIFSLVFILVCFSNFMCFFNIKIFIFQL